MARTGGRSWVRILLWLIGIAVVLFILIQFIPYGRSSHSNPPVTDPFAWTDARAEAVARESCYDCHSNETEWWWATSIAPFSWLVQRDVDRGRDNMNFSESDEMPSASEVQEIVQEGEMPPFQYTIIHPDAKLTDAEKQTLIQGYKAALGSGGASNDEGSASEDSATSAPASTTDGDALAIIAQRCSLCHPGDRAQSYRAGSAAEAQALVDQMRQRGAQVSAEEEQVLVAYFTR